MSEGPLTDCLDHIAQAPTDARSFIEDQNKDSFVFDKRTQRAVVMSLVIVGEAATKAMERYPARHDDKQSCRSDDGHLDECVVSGSLWRE